MNTPQQFIDLENVIRKKNPGLLKVIPSFIIRYLKRIIHQDELNHTINSGLEFDGIDFVNHSLQCLGTKYSTLHSDCIPNNGRYIFAANHPLGGLDGLVLMSAVAVHFSDVKFIVNDLLLNIKNLESVFVPVNKHGRQNIDYADRINSAYQSSSQILYFPAGLCSRKINGQITDLPWHKSFINKAVKYQRDIIPVYIQGRNSNFFYNLSNIRKMLGIKANIEMLYLVDEMIKQRSKEITVVFGQPIPYTLFDKTKTPLEWTNYVRGKVYSLSNNL